MEPLGRAVDRLSRPYADLPPLPPAEVERLLDDWDRFADEVADELGSDHRPPPDEALTRAGIYGDVPRGATVPSSEDRP